MNFRLHPLAGASLTLVAGLLGLAAAQRAQAQEPLVVRIAHVAATSGPAAHIGRDNENGARLAVEELNARGVRIGGRPVRLELVAEDDAGDPRQGTQVAQKLCDLAGSGRLAGVVGHMNSGTTLPASRIYHDCGLPNITPTATNPKITQQGWRTTFRLLADDDALGAGMAQYARQALQVRRVAVVDDRTAYGQGVAAVFRKTAQSLGMQVVAEHYTSDKAVDFTAILTALRAAKPDAIFYGGMDAQAGPMLRQMAQLGMSGIHVLGGDGLCTAKLPELASHAPTLAWAHCAEGGASLARMAQGAAWKQRYDARFPGQFQVYAPYTYDAVMVLADAMQRAGSADPKVYAPALFSTRWDGVTTQVRFDAKGNLAAPRFTVYSYAGGRKAAVE